VLNDTGYAVAALASYEKFKKARDVGVVGDGTRFQVSIPVPYEVIAYCVQERYQVEAEKLYECLIISDLQAIQAKIPAKDLAIQFDTPFSVVFLEGLTPTWFAPIHHREKLKYELGKRFDRMASLISADVELGFHLCYGDYGHKHFMEPVDTSILVELSNLIHACVSRTINWIHLPVPISRDDEAYFEPLRNLKLRAYGETELYLGCIHGHDISQMSLIDDIKGAERRIAAAVKVLGGKVIGVSTECGWGRYSHKEFLGMIEVSKAVASF
jgi:methionine synthase II (cobalamin-independent)